MFYLLKTLTYPIVSLILLILGNGLFTTFISIRLERAGSSNEVIGLIASAFYAGILMGSLRSPTWIARIGHLNALVGLCAANSAIILLHSLWIDPCYWALLRFMSGIVMGALFVVIESLFLLLSNPTTRSQSLSLYLFVLYGALSLGQLLLNIADPYSLLPFCIASSLSSLAILPLVISNISIPAYEHGKHFSLREVFNTSPQGLIGGTISGMVLASIYGLGPVYGQTSGLSITDIATLMSVIIFGGLSLQWPLGKWADLSGRRGVLVFACFAAALFSGLVGAFDGASWPMKLALLWLFGAFSFVLYPLSMAFTCEGVQKEKLVAATGGFVLAYGIGAIAGPLLAPLFMNWIGSNGLFYFLASICFAMGLIGAIPRLKTPYY
jgi:MFS family permease